VLKSRGIPIVVIEQNRRRVEELRARGVPAVYGEATAAGVLDAAHVDRARLIVVAVPDGFQVPRIIELARRANRRIDTVVRAHSEAELAHLERQGIGMAIMGERELALGMMDYALRSFGLTEDKARLVVQGIRTAGEGGAFERRPDPEPARAPELRPHPDKRDSAEAE
jgi:monovalent cation:H+ antiporter-2, CPA2 family